MKYKKYGIYIVSDVVRKHLYMRRIYRYNRRCDLVLITIIVTFTSIILYYDHRSSYSGGLHCKIYRQHAIESTSHSSNNTTSTILMWVIPLSTSSIFITNGVCSPVDTIFILCKLAQAWRSGGNQCSSMAFYGVHLGARVVLNAA